MVGKEMEDHNLEAIRKWIKGLSDETYGYEVEISSTRGIRGLLDESGNWHVSAIATLVDTIGSVVPYTVNQCNHVTLDLSISYYTTAKLQEEVEIEAKVVGKKDKLSSVIVEVRKKQNGELVALGKLWMAVSTKNSKHQANQIRSINSLFMTPLIYNSLLSFAQLELCLQLQRVTVTILLWRKYAS
ncbi:hypothetical protein VNO80_00206 [Phaseolus coccineus]|uniref:Thioesterase domain-containing protein n=1 Tax=Phaseolus coccineus TaxID=3886 RepID=A0AAN9NYE0_PHACN